MQSSDEAGLRITPDLLHKMVTIADVDDLERSDRDAWTADVELTSGLSAEFGNVAIPIVRDGKVIYGWDAVVAEQIDHRDGGRMMVVDITDLDWPMERVWALVVGLHRRTERTVVDQAVLAELLLEVQKDHGDWLDAAGWSVQDVNDLLAAVRAPSLEQLRDSIGGFSDDDNHEFWPWIKVQVSPATYRRWQEAMDEATGRNDSERVEFILSGGEA